jgi:hypothetical protein
VYPCGDEHEAKAAPSLLHWKVAPASDAENENEAAAEPTVPVGPAVIVVSGACRSILTTSDAVADRPAPFTAEQVTVVPAVSVVTAVGSQPLVDAMSDCGSAADHDTVTALVYQPFVPLVPARLGVTTGALESYLNVAAVLVVNPAPFVHDPGTEALLVSGPE